MTNKFLKKYGPWAFVTGATDGIGLAITKELARRDFNLILVGRRKEVLNQIREELLARHAKIKIHVLPLDLSHEGALKNIDPDILKLEIGLYVGAAGFGSCGDFVEQNLAEELNMIDVNCRAVVEQTHFFANRMTSRKRGGIILFSSLVSFQGTTYSASYSATKAFIQNFAEALHFELKPKGVHVLSVAPGPVGTGFAKRAKMKMDFSAKPEDVANSALRALGHQVTVLPGFLSKFLGYSLLILPRWARIRVIKIMMSQMAQR